MAHGVAAFLGCILAGLALCASAQTNLVPFAWHLPPASESALDLSRFLNAPAGKSGFVRVQDGHFIEADGSRLRLWGVNLAAASGIPTKELAPRIADDLALKEPNQIKVLCWGSLSEPAILVNHFLDAEHVDVLKKLRFIAHWTDSSLHQGSPEHPENVANCREDAQACAYMKERALAGDITYYECGAIGQHGIVSGSPKGTEYFNQFKISPLGKIFAEGKFVQNSVDHSDAAIYWTLLGNWGVSLKDIAPYGTNSPEVERANEEKFEKSSKRIHDELLRRARAAAVAGN